MTDTVLANVLATARFRIPEDINEPEEIREYIATHGREVLEIDVEQDDVDELWDADSSELIAGADER